jgi:uncharacterized protein YndB with AHSA1/START domain
MSDILIQLNINAPVTKVFNAFATADGLDTWWTLNSKANPVQNGIYHFHFGEGYDWKGRVTELVNYEAIEWEITEASPDWVGSKVGVILKEVANHTVVDFYHKGWAEASDHFRISSYCWAVYLRCMKANLERGVFIPYEDRLVIV